MSWIAFSFLAAVLWSVTILFDKFIADKEVSDPWIDVSLNGLGLYSILIIASIALGEISMSQDEILGGITVGTFYFSAILVYYRGIKTEEVSRFVPLFSTSAIFVTIFSFFLIGETFSLLTYLGILMTVAGAFLISLEDPIHSLKKFHSSKGFLIGISVALLFSFRDVSLKYFTSSIELYNLLFWVSITGLTLSASTIFLKREKINLDRGVIHLNLTGLNAGIAYILFTKAISIGPVSLASAIIRSQPLFVFIGSVIISKLHPQMISEQIDRSTLIQKLLAIILAITGLLIITLM